ncbi:uncharacterized protein Dana_GF18069 [Drosophila ananassae]|uniref:Uncharacterized protein n=1 Tax=Drosophila ananassae TaxID=7217 RepID=B3LVM0_DROAN|nr:uncharacterized protein Dana_GF18069 [Drosophila ananassae]
MSLGNVASHQDLQHTQHPLLGVIGVNNACGTKARKESGVEWKLERQSTQTATFSCSQTHRMHYYPHHFQPNHYYPSHYHQAQLAEYAHLGPMGQMGHRPALVAAASNNNGAYAPTSTGSAHSGYGIEPSVEYELQPESQSYPSAGSGPAYPPHHHSPPHHAPPPPPMTTKSSKKSKKSGAAVMNALTLLSFFFFVNMLQNCLKDHTADMNPTVMVLTASGSRNRFNKLAEMNSREQTSTMATAESVAESVAEPSWQLQPAVVAAPASSLPAQPLATPAVVLQSPYSGGSTVSNQHILEHQHNPKPNPHDYRPHIEDDDYNYGQRRPPPPPHTAADTYPYPNRTHVDHSSRPDFESDSRPGSDYYQHHYYPDGNERGQQHPWSYGSHAGRQRYSSAPWSSASLGAQSGVSSYLDNAQRRQGGDDDRSYGDVGADGDDDDGQQSRRRDAFYTRTRIN